MFGRLLWQLLRGNRGRLAIALVAIAERRRCDLRTVQYGDRRPAKTHSGISLSWRKSRRFPAMAQEIKR